MNIYIDIIFLENLVMNYIILFATAVILKAQLKIVRMGLASTLGSIYAIMVYMSVLKIYSSFFLKVLLSFAMIYIAFSPKNIKAFFKSSMIFYLTSFSFGGVAFALIYVVKPQNVLLQNGVLIGTYPIKMVLLGGIVGFIVITASFKTIKNKLTKKDMFCHIDININGHKKHVKSVVDTGNFLKDPISKAPVIVVEKNELYELISPNILDNIAEIICGKDVEIGCYAKRIKLIPFTSIGKENGMLLGIKPDSVTVHFGDNEFAITNVIIGIYEGTLSKNNTYHALLGIELLENNGGIVDECFTVVKI